MAVLTWWLDGGETSDLLDKEMAAARTAGVFGSPNIVVGSELFSGDDRLEEAMGHASISSVAALDT